VAEAAAVGEPRLASAWTPLRYRLYLALWIAQLVSNIGTWMQNVGAVWLMVTLGGGALLVALVQTATSLPVFLVGVPAGALADIVDRRRLLVATQTLMLAAAAVLAWLTWAGRVTPWALLGLTFALGVGSALNMPAWQAIQPELVPAEQFPQAVALGGVSINIGRAVGPAVGGVIVAAAGPQVVFALNAVSFLAVTVVLARWRRPRIERVMPAETLVSAIRAGFRYGRHSRALSAVLVRSGLFIVPASALLALLPLVARGPLRLGAAGFGGLLAAFGAGAIVSAVLLPRLRAWLSVDAVIAGSTLLVAAAGFVLAYVHQTAVVAVVLVVGGAGWVSALSALNVAAQGAVPEWVRARGMALYLLVFQGGVAAGSALWGVVAGVRLAGALAAAAVMLLGGLAVAPRWPLRMWERLDLRPSPVWPEPVVILDPAALSRPVLVTLAYQVVDGQVEGFLEAMVRVGRMRRRTGARRWGLFQDSANPERFLETFLVDSWHEHVRQHQRPTASDQQTLTEVAVHLVADPAVTHYISAY
jgi:MFS family permease